MSQHLDSSIGTFSTYHFNVENMKNTGMELIDDVLNNLKNNHFKMICHIAVHEIGHMFGTDHCIYFACNMNGCMSLLELVQQPLYLCPIDLHKLMFSLDLDIVKRHELLKIFYKDNDFNKELEWSNSFV